MPEQPDPGKRVSTFRVVVDNQQRNRNANVISLTEARREYDMERCHHWQLIIDTALNEVECDDCGARLNPVEALMRFARQESRLFQRQAEILPLLERLEKKSRTKCQHCGKMTRVNLS